MGRPLTKKQIRSARAATVYLQNMDKAVSNMKRVEAKVDIAVINRAFAQDCQNHMLRVFCSGMKPVSVAGKK